MYTWMDDDTTHQMICFILLSLFVVMCIRLLSFFPNDLWIKNVSLCST